MGTISQIRRIYYNYIYIYIYIYTYILIQVIPNDRDHKKKSRVSTSSQVECFIAVIIYSLARQVMHVKRGLTCTYLCYTQGSGRCNIGVGYSLCWGI